MKEFDYLKYIKERKLFKEDMDDWGDEKDDYGRSEKDYKRKPSLADFDYDEEEYKAYMEKNFPGEPLNLGEAPNPSTEDMEEATMNDAETPVFDKVSPKLDEVRYVVQVMMEIAYNNKDAQWEAALDKLYIGLDEWERQFITFEKSIGRIVGKKVRKA